MTIDLSGVSAGQVRGNPDELTRVIRNLLDNAVRHATSTVSVAVTSRDGSVRIHVDDDGPGIPLSDKERIFDRFTRVDSSRHRQTGGAGLGLAIVADLVKQHQGTVTVEDSPVLYGSRFTVVLPDARS